MKGRKTRQERKGVKTVAYEGEPKKKRDKRVENARKARTDKKRGRGRDREEERERS